MSPEFLSLAEVLEIHKDQIERYGGVHGIRDMGLLLSAIAMPSATFGGEFLHADIFEMAAAYLFHIVQNHPFLDGNKRTGAVTSLVFLNMNGIEIDSDEDSFEMTVLATSAGQADKHAIADFFRNRTHP